MLRLLLALFFLLQCGLPENPKTIESSSCRIPHSPRTWSPELLAELVNCSTGENFASEDFTESSRWINFHLHSKQNLEFLNNFQQWPSSLTQLFNWLQKSDAASSLAKETELSSAFLYRMIYEANSKGREILAPLKKWLNKDSKPLLDSLLAFGNSFSLGNQKKLSQLLSSLQRHPASIGLAAHLLNNMECADSNNGIEDKNFIPLLVSSIQRNPDKPRMFLGHFYQALLFTKQICVHREEIPPNSIADFSTFVSENFTPLISPISQNIKIEALERLILEIDSNPMPLSMNDIYFLFALAQNLMENWSPDNSLAHLNQFVDLIQSIDWEESPVFDTAKWANLSHYFRSLQLNPALISEFIQLAQKGGEDFIQKLTSSFEDGNFVQLVEQFRQWQTPSPTSFSRMSIEQNWQHCLENQQAPDAWRCLAQNSFKQPYSMSVLKSDYAVPLLSQADPKHPAIKLLPLLNDKEKNQTIVNLLEKHKDTPLPIKNFLEIYVFPYSLEKLQLWSQVFQQTGRPVSERQKVAQFLSLEKKIQPNLFSTAAWKDYFQDPRNYLNVSRRLASRPISQRFSRSFFDISRNKTEVRLWKSQGGRLVARSFELSWLQAMDLLLWECHPQWLRKSLVNDLLSRKSPKDIKNFFRVRHKQADLYRKSFFSDSNSGDPEKASMWNTVALLKLFRYSGREAELFNALQSLMHLVPDHFDPDDRYNFILAVHQSGALYSLSHSTEIEKLAKQLPQTLILSYWALQKLRLHEKIWTNLARTNLNDQHELLGNVFRLFLHTRILDGPEASRFHLATMELGKHLLDNPSSGPTTQHLKSLLELPVLLSPPFLGFYKELANKNNSDSNWQKFITDLTLPKTREPILQWIQSDHPEELSHWFDTLFALH